MVLGLAEAYGRKLRELLSAIDGLESVPRAAALIADRLVEGASLHIHDTGHMLMTEGVGRAGGLLALTPLKVQVQVDNPVRPAARQQRAWTEEDIRGLVRYALRGSHVRPGDVLVIGSVSGTRPLPVELALQARDMGVHTVGITSFRYSAVAQRHHSSGRSLAEVVDVAIDNVGEVGDAAVEVPGLQTRICPTSGITAAYILWLLTAHVVERLAERGTLPQVYRSINLPDGEEWNRRARQVYEERGY